MWVELDGLGDEYGALAVDVDGATLLDEHRAENGDTCPARDHAPDLTIVGPLGPLLCAPTVERPCDSAELAGVVDDEGWSDVAHPRVVERCFDDLDLLRELGARTRRLGRVDDHDDLLELRDRVGNLAPRGVRGLGVGRALGEGGVGPWKRHPHTLVGGRLGGHCPGHIRAFRY